MKNKEKIGKQKITSSEKRKSGTIKKDKFGILTKKKALIYLYLITRLY